MVARTKNWLPWAIGQPNCCTLPRQSCKTVADETHPNGESSHPEDLDYSQQWVSVIHCFTKTYIDCHCTQVKVDQNSGKISLLTDYWMFWYPQIRYKISSIYHWVSKLSQKWLLKVKNGMLHDPKQLGGDQQSFLCQCRFFSGVRKTMTSILKFLLKRRMCI